MCEWFATQYRNSYRRLPETVEKSIKFQTSSIENTKKNKLIPVVFVKNRKIEKYKITEANIKNQIEQEYVLMIYYAISEFLHSTSWNRIKINNISDKFL